MLIALFVLLTFAVAGALASLARRPGPPDLRLAARFSPQRYVPLERILSPQDYVYIGEVAGFNSKPARLFRRGRRRAGRQYLKSLRRDYGTLHQVARFMVVNSEQDQPQMARGLLKGYMLFHYRWVSAHMLLFACTTPLAGRLGAPLLNYADQLIEACTSLALNPSAAFGRGDAA